MENVILIALVVLAVPLIAGIWLIGCALKAREAIEDLRQRMSRLEGNVARQRTEAAGVSTKPTPVPPPLPVVAPAAFAPPPETKAPAIPPSTIPDFEPIPAMAFSAEPAPPPPAATPPPIPSFEWTPPALPLAKPAINWEQFMGVKGFAWVGGFALFLGIAFFVKYSFDNNLISPELRAAIGFLAGLGLVVGGVVLSRHDYATLSQTLCATGVVVLYAVTFACRAFYHFAFFGPLATFFMMSLITVAAFLLAVRLNAQVVALLGMLGGFLTPVLLSTGQDNPLGLFGYIAILDIGLLFVALNRRWDFLPALAGLGTILLQVGWAGTFFEREKYFEGNKIFIALGILLAFNVIFLAANWMAKKREQFNAWLAGANLALAAVALAFTLFFFGFHPLAQRPVLLFSFVFVIDLIVAALSLLNVRTRAAQAVAGLAVFGLLAVWTCQNLTASLLNPALAFYFVFAVFHSALPAWMGRRPAGPSGVAAQFGHLFPPIALALVLVPILKLRELSFLIWPFVLLVDLLAMALAAVTATLLPVLAVLLLTLAAIGALILRIPAELSLNGLPTAFFMLSAFAIFFVAASVWLVRKLRPDIFKNGLGLSGNLSESQALEALLPATSAVLPFLLLIMATLRLPLANPSPLFGLALLLVVLILGLARLFALDELPLVGLVSAFAVECAWHFNRFEAAHSQLVAPSLPLAWYLIFFAVFAAFPFVFLKKFAERWEAWAAAALAGPAQFLLIYRLVKSAWPNSVMGLLPAAFAVPELLCLLALLKLVPAGNKARLTQLAWFGGVALFFVTLIFPIQFDRQWITIGWALEGAALLWLFHRVPHPGLRLTGFGLLVVAFARLALNPAVLEYHARSATPIFNWYLYTYGLVTAALWAGARLLAPPRQQVCGSNGQAVLGCLVPTLGFLLLNIEIADYFSAPGSTLTFDFSGSFARDMTYSIAWALFALGLLVYGIRHKMAAARYPAMALLCVTLIKLFLHDLARLGQLYRIGAFLGVAVVAMLASFAYHKFYAASAKPLEVKHVA